jgi:hypothetical protein
VVEPLCSTLLPLALVPEKSELPERWPVVVL